MIYGIGTDIVQKDRIDALLLRFGDRFAARILTEEEMADFLASVSPSCFLAKRFAAKEAFSKAMGLGLRFPVVFSKISISRDGMGKPGLKFHGELEELVRKTGICSHHLSISDERDLAVAMVVLEK